MAESEFDLGWQLKNYRKTFGFPSFRKKSLITKASAYKLERDALQFAKHHSVSLRITLTRLLEKRTYLFLDDLRNMIGEEQFTDFIAEYQSGSSLDVFQNFISFLIEARFVESWKLGGLTIKESFVKKDITSLFIAYIINLGGPFYPFLGKQSLNILSIIASSYSGAQKLAEEFRRDALELNEMITQLWRIFMRSSVLKHSDPLDNFDELFGSRIYKKWLVRAPVLRKKFSQRIRKKRVSRVFTVSEKDLSKLLESNKGFSKMLGGR